MSTFYPLVISLFLASVHAGGDPNPQILEVSRAGGHVLTQQGIDSEKLKFTRPWPDGLLSVHHAISMHRPAEAKRGLDWIYQELARQDTDSKEWKALWFEYRIYSCLFADYEGRITERDKWLDEFPLSELDVRPFPDILAPLALGRKITSRGYKLSNKEIEEFSRVKVNRNTIAEFFGTRRVQEIRDPRVWAEIAAVVRYKGSTRGLAEIHAQRLWELDKRQSLSALVLSDRLRALGKPEDSLAMVNASLPYAPKGLVTDWLISAKKMAEAKINQKKTKAARLKP